MKKINEFIRKNYISFMIVIAIILVVIGSLIIINIINSRNKIEVASKNVSVYQYFNENKNDINATLIYEDDILNNIESNDHEIYLNAPVYFKDEKKVIIPKQSSIVFYSQDNLTYKLNRFAQVFDDSNSTKITYGKSSNLASSFFIYDGDDLYFFVHPTKVNINDTIINLSSYSYVLANNDTAIYYDYETDKVNVLENVQKFEINLGNTTIDALKDVTVMNNDLRLLKKSIDSLENYIKEEK